MRSLFALTLVGAVLSADAALAQGTLVGADVRRIEAYRHQQRGEQLASSDDITAALMELELASELLLAVLQERPEETTVRKSALLIAERRRALARSAKLDIEALRAVNDIRTLLGNETPLEILAESRAIEARLGFVKFSEVPSGAIVRLDGRLLPETVVESGLLVEANRHTVDIRAAGYKNYTETFPITGGERRALTIKMDPSVVRPRLRVISPVDGAKLTIDGESQGTLPFDNEIAAGKHEYTVEAEGYRKTNGDIKIEEGERRQVDVALVRDRAARGARIEGAFEVGGVLRGDTPFNNNVERYGRLSDGSAIHGGGSLRAIWTGVRRSGFFPFVGAQFMNRPLNSTGAFIGVEYCPTALRGSWIQWCVATLSAGVNLPATAGAFSGPAGIPSSYRAGSKVEYKLSENAYLTTALSVSFENYSRDTHTLWAAILQPSFGLGADL